MHETALNVAPGRPGADGCAFHSEPSHRSTRPLPTAVHESAVTHEIEFRTAWGLGPTDHRLPFHCCETALQSRVDGQDRADKKVLCDGVCLDHRDPFQLSANVPSGGGPSPTGWPK